MSKLNLKHISEMIENEVEVDCFERFEPKEHVKREKSELELRREERKYKNQSNYAAWEKEDV